MRINKYIARCGVVSRRRADELIKQGKVAVNNEKVITPGINIDEIHDVVCVEGKIIRLTEEFIYIVLNKPAGYITSRSDPHNKKTVMELLNDVSIRVNPIGRLDKNTTGVLLLTNDGELNHRMAHPKYKIKRIYHAIVSGLVEIKKLELLAKGIELPDGAVGRAKAKIIKSENSSSELELELSEGRKREVKNLCKAIGHPVMQLERISYGGISCGELEKGRWRQLLSAEITQLKTQTGLAD